ncbi:MAG: hypothetical protein AB2693_27290 [Candidatus Thiodiazotropha sp.]
MFEGICLHCITFISFSALLFSYIVQAALTFILCISGELIGVEFLYNQTGKVLQDYSQDPDSEEAGQVEVTEEDQDEEADEGFQDDEEIDDLTVTLVEPTVNGQTRSTSKKPVRSLFTDSSSPEQETQQPAATARMSPEPSTSYSETQPQDLDPQVCSS